VLALLALEDFETVMGFSRGVAWVSGLAESQTVTDSGISFDYRRSLNP
jgi:hypothetical protein